MSLSQYIEDAGTLNESAFKAVSNPGGVGDPILQLRLTSVHSVHSKLGGLPVSGRANVDYIIDCPRSARTPSLKNHIDPMASFVAYQSGDHIRSAIEHVKVKESISLSAIGNLPFDMRALAYSCGLVAAAASSTGSFTFATGAGSTPQVKCFDPTWSLPNTSCLMTSPSLNRSRSDFLTLCKLAGMSGVKVLITMANTIPPMTGGVWDGMDLAAYCLKVFSAILTASQSCACAAHHAQAFFCGMNYHFTLHSHSDEGGWIREALREAKYPASSGLLVATGTVNMGLPDNAVVERYDVVRTVVGLFLEFAGTLVSSDVGLDGPTVMVKEGSEDRPGSFPMLRDAFYCTLQDFQFNLCDDYDFHKSSFADDFSCDSFFIADRINRHFSNEAIVPFFWIEPGPLQVKVRNADSVMCQGKPVEIPFCVGATVYKSRNYVEAMERVTPDSAVYVVTESSRPRRDGFQYLLSSRYRRENGLSLANAMVRHDLGAHTIDALFVNEGVSNMAARRWVTPHCPTPNPAEGRSDMAFLFSYTYRGKGGEPTAENWSEAVVSSTVSTLMVCEDRKNALVKKVCSHASEAQVRWLNQRDRFSALNPLDILAPEVGNVRVRKTLQPPAETEVQLASIRDADAAEIADKGEAKTGADTEVTVDEDVGSKPKVSLTASTSKESSG